MQHVCMHIIICECQARIIVTFNKSSEGNGMQDYNNKENGNYNYARKKHK